LAMPLSRETLWHLKELPPAAPTHCNSAQELLL